MRNATIPDGIAYGGEGAKPEPAKAKPTEPAKPSEPAAPADKPAP